MWYIGFVKRHLNHVVLFRSWKKPTRTSYKFFLKVLGPFDTEEEARYHLRTLKRMYGVKENPVIHSECSPCRSNPATSERQRRFMCAELGRKRAGKKTRTGMTEQQLRDFCKKNPGISVSQIKRGTVHELEHTTDPVVACKIAMDHLKEDPYYYTHLAKMEKQYKKNGVSRERAIVLTKKLVTAAKRIYGKYKTNPGEEYHNQRFIRYMKELEKYDIGSQQYIATLAKAYEHLESAKDSTHEYVR